LNPSFNGPIFECLNQSPFSHFLKIFSVLNGHPRLRFFRERRATQDGPRLKYCPLRTDGPMVCMYSGINRWAHPLVSDAMAGPKMIM
jgi:hypothetical protein